MAVSTIRIISASLPIRPVWKKVPKEIRAGIKIMLGTKCLRELETFSITLIEKEGERKYQGYARTTLLHSSLLNFEVVIQSPESHLQRLTIQRVNKDAPFIRLI